MNADVALGIQNAARNEPRTMPLEHRGMRRRSKRPEGVHHSIRTLMA